MGEEGNTIEAIGIPTCAEGAESIGTDGVDLSFLVPDYIVNIPVDPLDGNEEDTGYTICYTSSKITVAAPKAENDRVIEVKDNLKFSNQN